jgi:hypothetical protein
MGGAHRDPFPEDCSPLFHYDGFAGLFVDHFPTDSAIVTIFNKKIKCEQIFY